MWFLKNYCILHLGIIQFVLYVQGEYDTDLGRCGKVHITVSSLSETYIELNWVTKCDKPDDVKPDEIALYDKNPLDRDEETPPRVLISAYKYPEGYYRTKIKFGDPWLPGNWEYHENKTRADPGQHCFPYWIVSLRNNFVLDSQCFKINPTWMTDNSQILGPHRISNLFIPGTHNSGTSKTLAFLQNYIMNQDRSIWTQLVFGIRYLDIRVGYYENEGFFINHDVARITELVPVLRTIKRFAKIAPKEVIILDFHRFPYPSQFTANIHEKLITVLGEELEDLAVVAGGFKYTQGLTLNKIWAQNKNIVICYGVKEHSRYRDWLWNPLQQLWANTRNVDDLKIFLGKTIKDHKLIMNPMWALMAELTPKTIDVIFRTNNLRKLADIANRQVTKWFRDEWTSGVNIVATDYFLGNDIINVAIDRNLRCDY